jgi:hypothetical protein
LILEIKDHFDFFEIEIEKALKNSIFEFKIVHIFFLDKEKNNVEKGQEKKILYYGTKIDYAIKILCSQFRETRNYVFGKGVYFTDSLDYIILFSREKLENFSKIPNVGDYFTFVASEVYYDKTKIETVYDYSLRNVPVQKNGIRCYYSGINRGILTKNELNSYNGPIGKEYLITDNNQILPLFAVTVKRIEYLVIWRDYNFNSINPNNYSIKVFDEMQKFHIEIKRIINQTFNSKIYYVTTTEEALKLIERKKYNK